VEVQLPDASTIMKVSEWIGGIGGLLVLYICRQLWRCAYLLSEIHFDIKGLDIGLKDVKGRVINVETFQMESKTDRAVIHESLKAHEARITKLEDKT
jgi:hypothetical protein